jgi:hypothetical protein
MSRHIKKTNNKINEEDIKEYISTIIKRVEKQIYIND